VITPPTERGRKRQGGAHRGSTAGAPPQAFRREYLERRHPRPSGKAREVPDTAAEIERVLSWDRSRGEQTDYKSLKPLYLKTQNKDIKRFSSKRRKQHRFARGTFGGAFAPQPFNFTHN